MMHTRTTSPSKARAHPEALDDFRVHTQTEIGAMLRDLNAQRVLVTISTPEGIAYTTTVWDVDASRGTVSFSADADDPRLPQMLDADEAVAIAYLDSIKVQFDVNALVLVRGQRHSVLNCEFPREAYRIQRRANFRVRPIGAATPCALVRQPGHEQPQVLRVVDVSLGGVALHLAKQDTAIEPGMNLKAVDIELDADTHLSVDLAVHHATVSHREESGVRLGCEFLKINPGDQRTLQRYIDQTQKRRRLLEVKS